MCTLSHAYSELGLAPTGLVAVLILSASQRDRHGELSRAQQELLGHDSDGTYVIPSHTSFMLFHKLEDSPNLVYRREVLPSVYKGMESLSPQSSGICLCLFDNQRDGLSGRTLSCEQPGNCRFAHSWIRTRLVLDDEVFLGFFRLCGLCQTTR